MENDCAQKKKKMDDELKRIEEANAGYESMGMEIAGLKEELEEAKAALQEASEESVDSQLQGFMDDCNALKAEIDKVNPILSPESQSSHIFFLHSTLGWAFKSLQSLRAVNSWPLRRVTCYYIEQKNGRYQFVGQSTVILGYSEIPEYNLQTVFHRFNLTFYLILE